MTPGNAKKVVKVKFLNGDSHYSQQELELLREWFKQEGPKEMRTLYLKHILSGFPHKTIQFQGSPLDKLFKELC